MDYNAEIILRTHDKKDIIEQIQIHNVLEINDKKINQLLKKYNWDDAESCFVNIGANNIIVIVSDYTVTDKINFSSFLNSPSVISLFKCNGTNVDIFNLKIDLMQVDSQTVLLSNSKIQQVDVGLSEHYNKLQSVHNVDSNISTAFSMRSLDIRACDIKSVKTYIECYSINIQESEIGNFDLIGGFGGKEIAQITRLLIWEYTTIRNFEIHCKISILNSISARLII